ncbi:uncharacterized protein BT62DRAFT_281810 [Guyanagaster necrorhizus]|uniref:Uncharacterized protein n=1 Tax=Guyanagaster necrorhizus TaxID=856835 RepID=A0A9P7W4R8_9AGAR|nr:uncharacterized protein BT62DRAFT_281810 [Guyanagaster necrorhizus MCA 3950]KAG7452099.1 hypothetical protein BT62DRAFT_281810 [Guyanagaster necrorhizus MCA 3950]
MNFRFCPDVNSGAPHSLGAPLRLHFHCNTVSYITGYIQATIDNGRRSNSAVLYLGPELINRTNLRK